MTDPFVSYTPEQKALFLAAQNELQAILAPWFVKHAGSFDPPAMIFSLMISVARLAQGITPPIEAQGWTFASASCFHVAASLNAEAAAAETNRSALHQP